MTRFGPRHTTISRDPAIAAEQLGENARDTLDALDALMGMVGDDSLEIDWEPDADDDGYTPEVVQGYTDTTTQLVSHLRGISVAIYDTQTTANAHASRHLAGGTDEVDGDTIDIDYPGTGYTPATASSYSTQTYHLTSHLKGLGTAVAAAQSTADSKITTGASVGGDLSGTIASATVAKIQGRAMANTPPSNNQVIQWDNANSTWKPATITTGVSSVYGRTGIVTAATDDYTSTQITNSSSVSGTGVTGALNTLLGYTVGWRSVSTQSGTGASAYTFALTDAGTLVLFSGATAKTVTIPTNASVAFATGTVIGWAETGGGQITFGGAGVTIRQSSSLTSRAQYASGTITKIGTDTWILAGDTT